MNDPAMQQLCSCNEGSMGSATKGAFRNGGSMGPATHHGSIGARNGGSIGPAMEGAATEGAWGPHHCSCSHALCRASVGGGGRDGVCWGAGTEEGVEAQRKAGQPPPTTGRRRAANLNHDAHFWATHLPGVQPRHPTVGCSWLASWTFATSSTVFTSSATRLGSKLGVGGPFW